jgi:hypothetical protein
MEHSIVGAGSPRELNFQSVHCLLTDDTKPALATQQQTCENPFPLYDARAGFKSTANHSKGCLYLHTVNEPAPTRTTFVIYLQGR